MVEAASAVKDAPSSQGVKALVPMSLSLVVKKEKLLQMEAAELEKLLAQRKVILGRMQESHEYMLTTNGRLQEKNRSRRERLLALRTLQEHCSEDRPGLCDAIGINELKATAEKCGVLKEVLFGLTDKCAGLENRCMELEEQTAREKAAFEAKQERMDEVRSTLRLLHEDINSTQWIIANDQAELASEENRLYTINRKALCQNSKFQKLIVTSKTEKAAVEDLQTTLQNYECMVQEEHRLLVIANENARSEQRELQRLLGNNGATCPADEEVLRAANDLRLRLQNLNEFVASAKCFKRELALRGKQEKDMLAITQSSIKAKDEQLSWLHRQCVRLKSEQDEASKVYSANEAAFNAFNEEHNVAMATLNLQIKDAEKHVKKTERAIATQKKRAIATSKKISQKTKTLQEWQAKMEAKQDQVAKTAATQKRVSAEVSSLQEALEQVQRREEQFEKLRTAQEKESLELRNSCAALEAKVQHMHTNVSVLNTSITATQTVVKNLTDEIRNKFLTTFVVDDAKILNELLDKELNSWITKDTDEVNKAIACETSKLNERYEVLKAETRKKFGKIMAQKEKDYDTKLTKLKRMVEKHAISQTCKKGEIENELATGHKEKEANESKAKCIEVTNCGLDQSPNHEDVIPIASFTKNHSLTAHSRQLKETGVAKQVSKSARRQLAPRLNLANESPQTDKELIDVFNVETAAASVREGAHSTALQRSRLNNARRPRLKRRTQAQKSGKPTALNVNPGTALVVDNGRDTKSTLLNPADEKSKQCSCESPIGCDGDLTVSNPARDIENSNETSSIVGQGFAKKLLAQKRQINNRNKSASKRRTSMKALHRPCHPKLSQLYLKRSQPTAHIVDWSTADTFSFD